MFYYAGHGLEIKDENYLVRPDVNSKNEESIASSAFSISELLGLFPSTARTRILLIDACRNLFKVPSGRPTGFKRVEAPSNTFIGFSAQPDQEAEDGIADEGSPFRLAFVRELTFRHEDLGQLFGNLSGTVNISTRQMQQPAAFSSLAQSVYLNEDEPTIGEVLSNAAQETARNGDLRFAFRLASAAKETGDVRAQALIGQIYLDNHDRALGLAELRRRPCGIQFMSPLLQSHL